MWRKVPRALALAGLLAFCAPVCAQAAWTVVTADSTGVSRASTLEGALDSLSARGFLTARLDSTRADTAFVWAGPRARIESLRLVGGAALSDPMADWQSREGGVFDLRALREDLHRTASRYARLGRVEARLVPDLQIASGGREVAIVVRVDEGPEAEVVGVELVGARSPSRAFASRRAGLTEPTPPSQIDLGQVRRRLDATGLYLEVGQPTLARAEDGGLLLQVPVVEAPPGAFDVVLGYLPPTGEGGGSVVGNGRVDLRNLFGGGRAASASLERTPGLASAVSVAVSDPFLLGSPLSVGLAFEGASRDSTLARQRVAVSLRYALDPTLDLVATLAGEAVRPGTYGATLVDGRPRVRRTDDVLVGVGIAFARLDRPRTPRRGIALDVLAEQGRRGGDRLGTGPGSRRRLTVRGRIFVPTVAQQGLVFGADATVTQQQAGLDGLIDEGDLIRLGGAASFRGYDEDQFLARSALRALAEYRVRFDDASYVFAFTDAGGFDRPAGPGVGAERRTLLGYGAGLRVTTALGLATVTYALNPDLGPTRGKVHVGLQVGL
ncbi:hypothetical protein B1759_00120 [Rubrivirga sp. SAORIC476]|uniref:BamA/TamA family outer membrane protein n=1 Tax=Rubrivirga sp. SAORIC476 TaxID=1961794 RepID=UPI000BC49034|nr:BamA/TamA family outer membrane protein [Rubrivirga sp. SAORIC476]PAP82199.1 hypothetical protein B1759_00120 [Rubrivirga sp. SAORIC476]